MTAVPPLPPECADVTESGEVVPLADVECALARKFREAQGPGEGPVQHACMSNLIIFCDRPDKCGPCTAAVPRIVSMHPARVLLLLAEPEGKGNDLTARVAVRAHEAGEGHRVFSEEVVLHARGLAVQRLPFAVRSLVVGVLPINLWWADALPPPLGGVLFQDLSEHAEQVVFDSIGWLHPARGVAAVAAWMDRLERGSTDDRWRIASDLNWRRLKAWRRLLAQALDPSAAPGVLGGITEVALEHGPHAVVQAWELAGWLASRLGWRVQLGRVQPGVEVAWQLEAPHGRLRLRLHRLEEGPPVVRRMRIAYTAGGKAGALCFTSEEDGRRLAVVPEGTEAAPRTVAVQSQPLAELVGRQLSDRERDPVFRQTLATARALAERVLDQL
jgi:glucose-6-phosphate dehydrogenase assembly protein OpcA